MRGTFNTQLCPRKRRNGKRVGVSPNQFWAGNEWRGRYREPSKKEKYFNSSSGSKKKRKGVAKGKKSKKDSKKAGAEVPQKGIESPQKKLAIGKRRSTRKTRTIRAFRTKRKRQDSSPVERRR